MALVSAQPRCMCTVRLPQAVFLGAPPRAGQAFHTAQWSPPSGPDADGDAFPRRSIFPPTHPRGKLGRSFAGCQLSATTFFGGSMQQSALQARPEGSSSASSPLPRRGKPLKPVRGKPLKLVRVCACVCNSTYNSRQAP